MIKEYKPFENELIDTIAVVSSAIYEIGNIGTNGYFGVWYKATSVAGTPDIKIEYEMSYDDDTGNFVEPEGASDIVTNLIDENAHVESISPPPMRYLRFKVTGNVANPADTLLTLIMFAQ